MKDLTLVLIAMLLTTAQGEAQSKIDCAKLAVAACYRLHWSQCIVDGGYDKSYFCREPRSRCEKSWKRSVHDAADELKRSCEAMEDCRFEPASCFCGCSFAPPGKPGCACRCAGGPPARCELR